MTVESMVNTAADKLNLVAVRATPWLTAGVVGYVIMTNGIPPNPMVGGLMYGSAALGTGITVELITNHAYPYFKHGARKHDACTSLYVVGGTAAVSAAVGAGAGIAGMLMG